MDITKSEVLKLSEIFDHFKREKVGTKFSYFLTKNNMALKSEVEALKAAMTPSEQYQRFDRERAEMAKSMSDKDNAGNPIIINDSYQIIENLSRFDEAISGIKEKYSEDIKIFEKQVADYKDILKETISFEPYMIALDNMPDAITPEIMEILVSNNLINEK